MITTTRFDDIRYMMRIHDNLPIAEEDIESIKIDGRDPLIYTIQQAINLNYQNYSADYFKTVIEEFHTDYDAEYIAFLVDCIKKNFDDTEDNRQLISNLVSRARENLISTLEYIAFKKVLDFCIQMVQSRLDKEEFYYEQLVRLTPEVESLKEYTSKINPPILEI